MHKSRMFSKLLYNTAASPRLRLSTLILVGVVGFGIFMSCEAQKDPFSANNAKPVIQTFAFKAEGSGFGANSDSLKFEAGREYPMTLIYEDREFKNTNDRTLSATFTFRVGSGEVKGGLFSNPNQGNLSFQLPPQFSGEIFFIPDTTGRVELMFTLSDGLKESNNKVASTFFFLGENVPPAAELSLQGGDTTRTFSTVDTIAFVVGGSDNDGEIVSYEIDFNDDFNIGSSVIKKDGAFGSTFTDIVTYQYQDDQNDVRVVLTVTDNRNSISIDTLQLKIVTPPIAKLTVSRNCNTTPIPEPIGENFPVTLCLDASGSSNPLDPSDNVSETAKIIITRDDTVIDEVFPLVNAQRNFTFTTPGFYIVTLTVSNKTGLKNSTKTDIKIVNRIPVADFTFVDTLGLGFVDFDASGSTDPDAPTDKITSYLWNFGDGEDSTTVNPEMRYRYGSFDSFTVTLEVVDKFGGRSVPKQDVVEIVKK